MERAVVGGEGEGVVGADDKGLASRCDARDSAIYDAAGVLFAPVQGLCGGKEDALVAASDEYCTDCEAAWAHAPQQVLRVGMHGYGLQLFSHRLRGEGGAVEGVGARYKTRAGVGSAQTARVQAQAFVITARDASVRIARRFSGKTE